MTRPTTPMQTAVVILGPNQKRYTVGLFYSEKQQPCVAFATLPPGKETYRMKPAPQGVLLDEDFSDQVCEAFDIDGFIFIGMRQPALQQIQVAAERQS